MTNNLTNGTDDGDGGGGYSLTGYIIVGIILYIIVVLAIGGNALVIASVLVFRKLRTVTNYFIVSLAISDLLLALFVMDFNACFIVLGDYWPFGQVFCRFYISIDIMLSTASILNLCLISLDRYWAITSPFSYYQRVNATNAIILIVVVWVTSFLISVLPVMLGLHVDYTLDDEEFDFFYKEPTFCVLIINQWYALGSSVISFFIPIFIMGYTYARIFIVARRQARQIAAYNNTGQRIQGTDKKAQGSMRRERKATKTLAIIVGVFIGCWLPFFILNVVDPFCGRCVPPTLFSFTVWLGYVNSALNPIIYAQNRSFRNAFKTILFCYKCRGLSMRQADSSDDHTAMSNTSRQERLRGRLGNGYNTTPRPSHSDHRSSVENSAEQNHKMVKDTSLVIANKNANANVQDSKKDSSSPVAVATITHSDANGNAIDVPL
ncbi:D(1) dopamine receptor-like [Strongylocentrotus purpuratus]|uniref:G-protein coupled receptors family 1 profile domain-containing protein n=1 Tax=Strongylocentrotus purpuratus TaxID=7668 RepID=A0A7M7PAC9_STRPU|nr:D(1) dopamine receptor-like [Strongylocentrotus purpuratus]